MPTNPPAESAWIDPETARQLEQSGRRAELAARASDLLRKAIGTPDAEVFWHGEGNDGSSGLDFWVRRIGQDYFPDPNLFATPNPPFARWAAQSAKYLKDADDYWFHVYKPKPGDFIVDIGAGRGEDTFAFSRAVGTQGHVWAIEPHPQSFALLQAFCRLNRLSNVTTLRYACVSRPEQLQIETLPVWESNFVRSGPESSSSYPVEGVTFDSLCEIHGIHRIDFLKMNIEGAEQWALPGCRQALARTSHVCISAHDFRANRGEGESFRTLQFVRDFLTGAGFEITTRDNDPRYYVPFHVHGVRSANRNI